jgi:undecaprenyl-diphosphatase
MSPAGRLRLRMRERDLRAFHYVVERRGPRLDRMMRGVTHLGDPAVTIGLVLIMVTTRWPSTGSAWTAAFGLACSHVFVQLLKRSVARERPQLPAGMECMAAVPDRLSFPSGHAAAALSLAIAVGPSLDAATGTAVVGLALLVGVSRCYLGVHYPGDVLVAWLLAALGVAVAPPF